MRTSVTAQRRNIDFFGMSGLTNWENVCLVCLRKGGNRFIFEKDNDSNVIADKIMKCADIFIKRDTNQPNNICFQCLDDLNVAYKFRQNCEQSDSILKALVNTNHQEFQTKDLWKTTPIIVHPTHDVFIKDEIVDETVVDDTCDDDNSRCPDLEDDPDSQPKFDYEDRADAFVLSSSIEPDNITSSERNKTKQKANGDTSIQDREPPKTLTEESCDKAILKPNVEQPFLCYHCDKAFATASDLRHHLKGYTSQKPYKCQHCDRRYSGYSARKDHERTHTGERPYICPTCGKSFTYSHALVRHLRTHTGEKPFVCNECGKGFTKKIYFEKHVGHHLTQGELDKSSDHKQKIFLEKEIFKVQQCTNSNEIHIKHEVNFTEEEIN